MRYFEDVEVGDAAEFGEYQVTAEEVVAFAERYDPQPFHTDEAAAQGSVFGGLVASGWHTAAMCMRMRVDAEGKEVPLLGSRGVDELRWRRPVRPGDTLRVRTEVVDKRPSESRPDRGYVNTRVEGVNGDDEVAISWIGLGIVERAPDG